MGGELEGLANKEEINFLKFRSFEINSCNST